jgi:endogenous inhibitor of DNA gyrase (YacG/DUF329 family)
MIPIKCPSCQTLFGIEDDGVLTIKHRDLYRTIDGKVYGPCRRCGRQVTWSKNDDSRPRSTSFEDRA